MVRGAITIDISNMPDLARLAHEVAASGRPRVLEENGAQLAVLSPARRAPHRKKALSKDEVERILNETYGSWKGLIDPEEFKRQRRELQLDDREPRTW